MITMEPDFRDIVENPVLGNILGGKVTMIIDDGHISRIIVKQALCCWCLKEKILVKKIFHLLQFLMMDYVS
jgi:hypothetical protein